MLTYSTFKEWSISWFTDVQKCTSFTLWNMNVLTQASVLTEHLQIKNNPGLFMQETIGWTFCSSTSFTSRKPFNLRKFLISSDFHFLNLCISTVYFWTFYTVVFRSLKTERECKCRFKWFHRFTPYYFLAKLLFIWLEQCMLIHKIWYVWM